MLDRWVEEELKPVHSAMVRSCLILVWSAVLQNSFRFAVFPKRYITFNPMQYVVMRGKKEDVELFAEDSAEENPTLTITHE